MLWREREADAAAAAAPFAAVTSAEPVEPAFALSLREPAVELPREGGTPAAPTRALGTCGEGELSESRLEVGTTEADAEAGAAARARGGGAACLRFCSLTSPSSSMLVAAWNSDAKGFGVALMCTVGTVS